ncbi:ATP-binding cassette domain-containing protein [Candidatus Phyllobacterium onerii]|uniref:ATP-binding cassette domain-containing protein n=1 Tax=Candidatus Phyllobacterium onerii TaxID=3020828 RepID=UPI002330A3CA|nr:ATP-binding cassette domain-containing protein [Phyllobacterium sp. IY22]
MAQLSVEDLVVTYGSVTAVKDVSFVVEDGEFVSLLGPSGCGKTTTLRCIAGLEASSGGTIRIDGEIVAADGRDVPPEKRDINMVFQSYAVWPHMTVYENVAYGLRTRHEPAATIEAKVSEALSTVGLTGYSDRYGTELSGGQQQRVALARAIVTSPTERSAKPSADPDPAIVRLQVLLDRAGTSPGVIDGIYGKNVTKAVASFEKMTGMPPDGTIDPDVISRLETGAPMIGTYTVTQP